MRSDSQLGKRSYSSAPSTSGSLPWIQSSAKAYQPFVPKSSNPYGQYSQQYQHQQLQQQLQSACQSRPQTPFNPVGGSYAPRAPAMTTAGAYASRGPPMASGGSYAPRAQPMAPRLTVPQQPTNFVKRSATPGLVPVHDRATGKLSYFVQADPTDDQAISEDLGPYMTFAATEDSSAASEEQTY